MGSKVSTLIRVISTCVELSPIILKAGQEISEAYSNKNNRWSELKKLTDFDPKLLLKISLFLEDTGTKLNRVSTYLIRNELRDDKEDLKNFIIFKRGLLELGTILKFASDVNFSEIENIFDYTARCYYNLKINYKELPVLTNEGKKDVKEPSGFNLNPTDTFLNDEILSSTLTLNSQGKPEFYINRIYSLKFASYKIPMHRIVSSDKLFFTVDIGIEYDIEIYSNDLTRCVVTRPNQIKDVYPCIVDFYTSD